MMKIQQSEIEVARLEGRVEMIDFCLNSFCIQEMNQDARTLLKNIRYSLKIKINANTNAVGPAKVDIMG